MPVNSEPVVPAELCDTVIDHLHDDPRTLAACALVCRAWVPSSRMHQFHTVILHRFPGWRGRRLSLISDPSSTVLPYIRRLALGEGRGRGSEPYWLDEALLEIRVDDLVALEYLELIDLNWEMLSLESVSRLHMLCHRPQSVAVRLSFIPSLCSLLDLLQACDSAHKFVADGNDDVHELAAMPASLTMPQHLHTLEVNGFMAHFTHALCRLAPKHDNIRTVYIPSIFIGQAAGIARFMQWCGSAVEEISLDFPDPRTRRDDSELQEAPFCDAGGLKDNTSLRVINLIGAPSGLLSILRQVSSEVVEQVSINTAPGALSDLDFDGLAALFSRGVFASAKLRILGSDIPVQPLIEMRDEVYDKLSALREQGRLVFERAGGYAMDPSTPPVNEAKWGPPFVVNDMLLDHYHPGSSTF